MRKKSPSIFFFIVFLGFITFLIIYSLISNQTLQNDGTVCGNTAGNLYNGGWFCEYGDIIYFANSNDDNTLYSMNAMDCSNIKKIHNDRICYINVDENYIYYSRKNHLKEDADILFSLFSTGIYRVKRDGSGSKSLYKSPCGQLLLYGNHVYYQHYIEGKGLSLHRIGTDGKNNILFSDDALLPASVKKGIFYYSGVNKDHKLHMLSLSNPTSDNKEAKENASSINELSLEEFFDASFENPSTIVDRSTYQPIAQSEGLYFMTLGDYAIHRYLWEDKRVETLVSDPCACYNISNDGRFLYYQIDRKEDRKICFLDLSTMQSTTILNGDYCHIHVTSNYVFFTDFEERNVYAFTTDGSNQLNQFRPSIEKK